MAAEFKLFYFDLRARGESLRLSLEYAGVKYEDFRVPMDKWPEFKPKMPMGQMPVLECLKSGQKLSQTLAIGTFIAEKYGIGGKDAWEKARVLMMAAGTMDQWGILNKTYMEKFTGNAAAEKENWQHYKAEQLKTYLDQYSHILDENKSGWLVGSSLTWADLATAEYLSCLKDHFDPSVIQGYPKLEEYVTKVMGQPQLKGYLARRPKTLF